MEGGSKHHGLQRRVELGHPSQCRVATSEGHGRGGVGVVGWVQGFLVSGERVEGWKKGEEVFLLEEDSVDDVIYQLPLPTEC